ncbi:cytochrome P450 [Halovenus sp. WSH3]|uniref:Cytochrome P450 n=1 Tax=Halovenus carboxidivorans TaxID=2692199 RepID=A0A6B0T499_9EURY|nr:cytochrome P450 [Halovenus carboxidivorans]
MQTTPPGPRGEPLFGSGRQYSADPLRFVEEVERAYNGIAAFEMGPMETYFVAEPSAIEQILVGDADKYRKPDFQSDTLGDLLGDGLLLSEGDTWQKQRQLANPAFTMGRLASFDDRIAGHTSDLLDRWGDGERRDMEREMTRVTIDVIADLMLGTELSERQLSQLRENLEPIGSQFEPDPVRFALPPWVPLPGDRAYQSAVSAVDEIVEEIIADRRGTEGDGEGAPMDLLSILLRAQSRGEQSAQQLRDEVVTMLLAGHDTTALTLTYTWYLLSEHPEKRERLYEEVDRIEGTPTIDDVQSFEYLEWVIDEAMRLYPPVYTLFREANEAVELLGYEIPEDAMVMLSQWAVHRSPEYWDDPEQFRPERWADRNGHRFSYFPFGGGPRHCIGKNLAKLEAQMIVAMVASEYELSYEGSAQLELRPTLTLHPRDGMEMEISRRE